MPWSTFWLITLVCAGSIFIFRTVPLLLLADRSLPPTLERALDFVPVCAFAALVTNDLINPAAFSAGILPAVMPLIAAIPVVAVAVKTKSLALCIVVGVGAYALLMFLL